MHKEIYLKILELALDKVKDTDGLHLDSLLGKFTQGEIDTNIEYLKIESKPIAEVLSSTKGLYSILTTP